MKDPAKLFSISSDTNLFSKKGNPGLKGKRRDEPTLGNEDFDEVKYSKELLAYLSKSQGHTNSNTSTSGSNLASTLSCLGIEVVEGCRSAGRTNTRKQPSKHFAKRSQSINSATDKGRETKDISMVSTIAQNERFREENRKYRTLDAPMKNISEHKTELLDKDFDNVQFSNSSSHNFTRPLHKPKTKSVDNNLKRHDSGSKLESTLSCMGIEVIEPKHAKRKPKHKRERQNGVTSAPVHRSKDNNANELDTPSRKNTEKQTETRTTEAEQNSTRLSWVNQKLDITKSASVIDKQHQHDTDDNVNAENKLLINQTQDTVTRKPSNTEKRNKYQWSESYEKLKSLSKAASLLAKTIYTDKQPQEDELRLNEFSSRYTETENINDIGPSQNKHLKALLAIESKVKPKQSGFSESILGLKSNPYSTRDSLAQDNESCIPDNQLLSAMDKQDVSRSEPSVQRSISMPSEYTLYYKQKMLQMDNGKYTTKSMESVQSLDTENVNADSNKCIESSEKSKRKRKRSCAKLQTELNREHISNDRTNNATNKLDQLHSKTDQNKSMEVQRNMEANKNSFPDKLGNTRSKSIPRADISIVDSGLSYKELSEEEDFVTASKIQSKVGTDQRTDEAMGTAKEGTVTKSEPVEYHIRRSVDNMESNINPNAQFGKYVSPKQVKTAVVRPMLQENRRLSRSDSFTYSYSKPRTDESGLVQTSCITCSNDIKVSTSADLESAKLNRSLKDKSEPTTQKIGNNSKTSGRSKVKTAIRRKPSKEMPKFVNMSSLINANIMPATHANDFNTIVQNTTKVPGDRPINFHFERKQSFKFSNANTETSEGGHKSKAILFSRGMNEDDTSRDLNEITNTFDYTDREAINTIPDNNERNMQTKPGNPYRSSSFLVQSTMEKTMAVHRSKSERKVAMRGSKL